MRLASLALVGAIAFAAAGCSGGDELSANESMEDILKEAAKSPDANKPPEGRSMEKPTPPADAKK